VGCTRVHVGGTRAVGGGGSSSVSSCQSAVHVSLSAVHVYTTYFTLACARHGVMLAQFEISIFFAVISIMMVMMMSV